MIKLVLILIAVFVMFTILFVKVDKGDKQKKFYCSAESREAEVCTRDYTPVCGWNDDTIKCIKYPCASTYSNACGACQKPEVAYYTKGKCPA